MDVVKDPGHLALHRIDGEATTVSGAWPRGARHSDPRRSVSSIHRQIEAGSDISSTVMWPLGQPEGGEWQQAVQAQSSTCLVIAGFKAHEGIFCLGAWDPKEVFLLPLRGLDVPLCCVPGRAVLSLLCSSYRCLLLK